MQKRSEQQVNKILHSAKASLAIEGLQLQQDEERLVKQALMGRISQQEFVKQAVKLACRRD